MLYLPTLFKLTYYQEGGTARPTMEELRRGTRKEREKVQHYIL